MRSLILLKSSAVLTFLRLIVQIVSLLNGVIISYVFGASAATDDYYAALVLPSVFANLVINVVASVFAPIYLEFINKHPKENHAVLASLNGIALLAFGVGMALTAASLPLILALRGMGDSTSAVIFAIAFIPIVPIVGFSRLLAIYCETHGHYNISAVAALVVPIVFTAVMLLLITPLGIYALLAANLVAQSAELAIIAWYLTVRVGIPFKWTLKAHPVVKQMLGLMAAPAATSLALLLVPTLDRAFASSLPAGSLTAFSFGERFVLAFDQLVSSGILLIIYYRWANESAQQGVEKVAANAHRWFSLLNLVVIPICIGGALVSRPIISILFERGAFTEADASAAVFSVLMISLPFNYTITLLVRLLLLMKDVRAQAVLSISIAVLNTVLNAALIIPFGLLGIVLSTLISRAAITALALRFAYQRVPQLDLRPALRSLQTTLLCTGLMSLGVIGISTLFGSQLRREQGLLVQILALTVCVIIGAVVYGGAALLTRHPDLITLLGYVKETRYGAFVRWLRL